MTKSLSAASSSRRSASPASSQSGFSTNTGTPSASASSTTSACLAIGTTTTTPSTEPSSPISETIAVASPSVARERLASDRATTGTSQPSVRRSRRTFTPHSPHPTSPTIIGRDHKEENGASRARTGDLHAASVALSQLSYGPTGSRQSSGLSNELPS